MTHPMDDLERMEDAWDRMSADYGERKKGVFKWTATQIFQRVTAPVFNARK